MTLSYVIEPELPVIPDGGDLADIERTSLNNGGVPVVNGFEPDHARQNGEVNGIDELNKTNKINPETGEIIEEKQQSEGEEKTGKFQIAPTTVQEHNKFLYFLW